ncbi:PREDICTED: uncharacterized protein LOC105950271 [Erythranthe guttata]|uniref:uncharacterized protein LOC105950271 n=1 Tax=Erythranthe guttata TaxID=4155 RepID=UPI00064DA52B|nr:PREDICTED: uncharacterized protein LOC105950271 [Erythranthe guttata]|eukprot:XP_012829077.1 PREDICTED: uncharacterized protein LOC105950271 [Erythranthe guttata]
MNGCIDFAALRKKATGGAKKQAKRDPLKKAKSSSSKSREVTRVEALHASGDDRDHNVEGGELDRLVNNGEDEMVEIEYVPAPKRPRVDPEVSHVPPGGAGKCLFTYGVNREGKDSFWDTTDHTIALKKTEGFVGEYDRSRMSGKGRAHMLSLAGGDMCRLIATWRYLVEQEEQVEKTHDEERAGWEAREKELKAQLEAAETKLEVAETLLIQRTDELEISRSETEASKIELMKLDRCYDELKEKYDAEKLTGKRFLASSAGAAYKESVMLEGERRFQKSEVCRAMIEERAIDGVYAPLVRTCRQYLRKVGGIDEKIIRGMEEDIPDDGEDIDVECTEIASDAEADDRTTEATSARKV